MTKQQDNTTRDYSQFSKAEAIKEIEKITKSKLMKETDWPKYFIFEKVSLLEPNEIIRTIIFRHGISITFKEHGQTVQFELSKKVEKLIPILFKNETEQSKTIKDGE